jgi:hypothetical protein
MKYRTVVCLKYTGEKVCSAFVEASKDEVEQKLECFKKIKNFSYLMITLETGDSIVFDPKSIAYLGIESEKLPFEAFA